jgi:hypothetical protein
MLANLQAPYERISLGRLHFRVSNGSQMQWDEGSRRKHGSADRIGSAATTQGAGLATVPPFSCARDDLILFRSCDVYQCGHPILFLAFFR